MGTIHRIPGEVRIYEGNKALCDGKQETREIVYVSESGTLRYRREDGTYMYLINTSGNVDRAYVDSNDLRISGYITDSSGQLSNRINNCLSLNQTTPQIVASGAPTFQSGIIIPKITPMSDGTTAVQFTKADGSTAVINIDTTNSNIVLPVGYIDTKKYYYVNGSRVFSIDGTYNLLLGKNAGNTNTGSYCVFIGEFAGHRNGANYNIAIGYNSIGNTSSGGENVAVGYASNTFNTTGVNNLSLGANSLHFNRTGNYNVAVGSQTSFQSVSGSFNVAVGRNALYWSNANYNVAFGYQSLFNTQGDYNIGIGTQAGYSITSGTQNLFLGYNAGNNASQLVGVVNSVAIGAGAYTTKDNQIVLGNSSVVETFVNGDIKLASDLYGYCLGAACDAKLIYDGTNLRYNSRLVGTGNHIFEGGDIYPTGNIVMNTSATVDGVDISVLNTNFNSHNHGLGTSGYIPEYVSTSGFSNSILKHLSSNVMYLQTANNNANTYFYVSPSGVTSGSSEISIFSSDFLHDSTNYERIILSKSADGDGVIDVNKGGSGVYRNLSFKTGNTARMMITSSGNIGIGTSTPSAKLDVNGDVVCSGDLSLGTTDIDPYKFQTARTIGVGKSTEDYAIISIITTASGIGYLAFADGTSGTDRYAGLISYAHSSNKMAFRTAGSERITVDGTGKVGINTSSPNATLDVSGSIIGQYKSADGTDGFTGTGAYTNFTIKNGLIVAAS